MKTLLTRRTMVIRGTAALSLSLRAFAQDAAKPAVEPEYNAVIFALDQTNGVLTPLERKEGSVQSKIRALGYGGMNSYTVFEGEKSSVRFHAGDKLEFVMRVEDRTTDPSTLIGLEVVTPAKGKRQVQMMQARLFKGVTTTKGDSAKSLNFAKYGEHSFRFVPADPLAKGEYALTTFGSTSAFLFGID